MSKTHRSSFFLSSLFLAVVLIASAPSNAQTVTSTEQLKSTITSPERLSASFAEVARIVEPAVVSIDTKGKVPEVTAKGEPAPGDPDDIMDFFRRQLPRRPAYSVGSGFIVDKRGYIMTNAHVVEDAVRISVKLDSGEEFVAKVIGTDDETDLAVLKIEVGKDLPYVKLGDSAKSRVGDWVLAIGSPFGLTRTVTAGIISQIKRETPYASPFQKFIQTDAAINRGNSGGPLVNMDGEVIGVNSQIATSTGDYNGIGFALPSTEAASVYDQLLKNGKVRRGYLGVILESVKPEYAKVYGLNEAKGAIVTDVRDAKSPAGLSGLQVGDVIVEFDGKSIENAPDLIAKVSSTLPDKAVSMYYLRENGTNLERKSTSIKLGERPSNNRRAEDEGTPTKLPLDRSRQDVKPFGLTLTELTPTLAATYKLEGQKGLLVKEINPESFIADVKASNGGEALGEGDLIQRINRVEIVDGKSFAETVARFKKGDAVVLHVLAFSPAQRTPQLKIVQFTVQ
ncbi:MAG: trypsin-like peptidase domain-containing protein [Saprospiraceae bacterium]|nr:trypsin-like peptidase domain-containing protein [Pyrinomonadaceae bacterium]